MAFSSEEDYEARKKSKVAKLPVVDKTGDAIKEIAKVSATLADVSTSALRIATESATESAVQTQELITALTAAIAKMGQHKGAGPSPVRLVISRKDRLIDTIDVIPLIKKADK